MQTLRALIIDSDQIRRGRLKQAMSAVHNFKNVTQARSLDEAQSRLSHDYDVVFASDSLDPESLQNLVEKTRSGEIEFPGAFLLILSGNSQNMVSVSKRMFGGIDGFLCEPFSVDGLLEAAELADRVRLERIVARQKAVATYLAQSSVAIIDQMALLKVLQKPCIDGQRMLKDMHKTLKELAPEALEFYFSEVIEAFLAAPAPSEDYEGKSERLRDLIKRKTAAKLAVEMKERELQMKRDAAKVSRDSPRIYKR